MLKASGHVIRFYPLFYGKAEVIEKCIWAQEKVREGYIMLCNKALCKFHYNTYFPHR